jgi:protein required for attachment to host cells
MSNQTTIPKNALVVISTEAEAQLYRNEGEEGQLQPKASDKLTPQNLADDGPSGKRPPESSSRETDEATFSKQLAQRLYAMAHAGGFDDLVLIADPDTLGELRPILHQEVSDKIVLEMDKTLINASLEGIERSINAFRS